MKFLRDGLNKVQDFVANPKVNNVAKIAKGMIDLGAQISQAQLNGPLSVAGAILGGLHVVQDALGADMQTPHEVYRDGLEAELEAEGRTLSSIRSSLPAILMSTGAINSVPHKIVVNDKTRHTYRIDDPKNNSYILFLVNANGNFPDPYIWTTKKSGPPGQWDTEFDFTILSEAFWSCIGGPIAKLESGKQAARLVGSPYGDIEYKGVHDPESFTRQLKVYQDRGISRGALLHGPPGTGKTSFVRSFARLNNYRVLVVPPAFLQGYNRNEIEIFVDILRPDVILFDDIDRAAAGLEYAMTCVEDLRRIYPKMMLFSTVNQIQSTNAALLRPGRLGVRTEFLAPNKKDKMEVFKYYLETYKVTTPLNHEKLVAKMRHSNFSHDYVRFIAEQAVVMSEKELMACIEDTVRYLNLIDDMEPDTTDAMVALSAPPSSDDDDDD